ncbi:phosphoethanolamine transferase [Cupriavidus sp. AU9028]|uniref:phosphoethanolamine transferase n=1 Tax=Cupriavidus sp. AU9028 TaxID=2871157 RepID=UPI001C989F36|nr:phosphoethanolamine--lipid A transferase [Cupriavidus sp. AU9028]MBY4895876.1 phosphoethanolamine--lipid A transferase [Cupriavidus sp. AU9028]
MILPRPAALLHAWSRAARRPGAVPLRVEWLTVSLALFLLVFCNVPFWSRLLAVHPLLPANAAGLLAAFAFLLVTLHLALHLLAWPWVLRPVGTVLLLSGAVVSYFAGRYGVMVDVEMVRNALQTDAREAWDLVTPGLAAHVAALGVLPAFLLWRTPIRWRSPGREIVNKGLVVLASVVLLAGIGLPCYQTFSAVARNHRELRLLLTPLNLLQATSRYVRHHGTSPQAVVPFGTDAVRVASSPQRSRPAVTVLVIGETARADHFSLNGYPRDTNPLLSREPGLISFADTWSCGTETAVSLPCMFSGLTRKDFDVDQASRQEGLLDILQRAGLEVEWQDNQSGCKGVCDRVVHATVKAATSPGRCTEHGCLDEALLEGLGSRLDRLDRDAVIVLHMMGSHGPAYHHRYPASSGVFRPACGTSELDQCSREEIVNAYDNSIRYTDTVLAGLLGILRQHGDRLDTAMIYVSDHGESLGEHGLYLHGTPYALAPDGQKHVPMLMWFSDGFQRDFGVDTDCLRKRRTSAFSHDHLFHSMLGLLDVHTGVYRRGLDLFADCRSMP